MARRTGLRRRGKTIDSRTRRASDNRSSIIPRHAYRMVRGGGRTR